MTRFTPQIKSIDNWNVLIFDFSQLGIGRSDDRISQLPDLAALNDLFYPWHREIPTEYQLESYMNRRDPSLDSTLICQKYSNYAVQKNFQHYADPSRNLIPHGEFLRRFCERHSQVYEYYEFYLLVKQYFETMCPITLNSNILPSMSIHLNSQFDSIRIDKRLEKTGNEKRDKEIGSINEIRNKIDNHIQNILITRFDQYKIAHESTAGMLHHFELSEEGKAGIPLIVKEGRIAYEKKTKCENDRAKAKTGNLVTIQRFYGDFKIRQCWFCGEFYELPKSKANNYSRHCNDAKCKKSDKAWVTFLERKGEGESPDSLGLGIKKGRKPQ